MFRSLFDNKQKAASDQSGIEWDPDTAQYAQQSDKDSCDLNKIIAQFHRTGILPVSNREAFYADITELQDANAYQKALDTVIRAEEAFYALPAHIRTTFGNDPKAFVDAMDKKQFTKEMVDAGLLNIIEAAPAPSKEISEIAEALRNLALQNKGEGTLPPTGKPAKREPEAKT